MINKNPEKRFIYCSPYLKELDRIIQSTGSKRFHAPEYQIEDIETQSKTRSTKLESFNVLLRSKVDIASTHCTFLNANEATKSLLRDSHYTLLIDEALEVVQPFDAISSVADCERQKIDADDIKNLLNCGYIQISEETGQVRWIGDHWAQFSELEKLSKRGGVYCAKNSMLMYVFHPEVFSFFTDVYVFTYGFVGTPMRAYFDKYEIPYEVLSVKKTGKEYQLTEYCIEAEYAFREYVKSLITIYTGKHIYPKTTLCKSWTEKADEKKLNILRSSMEDFFRRIAHARCKDAMWSCVESCMKKLQPKGYGRIRGLTKQENKLPDKSREKLRESLRCFVPCNARASNDFKSRRALAYCLNLYPPVDMESFFTSTGKRVSFSRDQFAIQSLIQWIFRSCIRDGKPIDLFLPSQRMQKLLASWLDGEDLLKKAA